VQARSDIGIVQSRSRSETISRERGSRCYAGSRVNSGAACSSTINEFTLFEDADCCTRGVGDLLHSLGDKFRRGGQIQLQSLNQLLGFYNRGQVFREVGLEPLGPQAVVVLLEHISGREQLLKRRLVKQRLTLRAGSSLGHKVDTPPAGEGSREVYCNAIHNPNPLFKACAEVTSVLMSRWGMGFEGDRK
jgi:hypothetical protein